MESLSQDIQHKIDSWLHGPYDDATKAKIRSLLDEQNFEELTESFYKNLEFGTGGLRGIMGVGSNRMNKYTIGIATQGLCNYLKKTYPNEHIKFALTHDNRNNSSVFAQVVADVCSANGITVYFFEDLRPTPELSFAIRHLGCQSGVMLTASHNPKEYNGYKAYWSDGGQVISPHDKNIIEEVNKIGSPDQVNFAADPKLIHRIGKEVDDIYIEKLLDFSIEQAAVKSQHDLCIVYSPIHGTGVDIVPRTLKAWGFSNVNVVPEQAIVDGNFPTVIYPNPEEEEAMKMSLDLGRRLQADIIMATDPDADRVGIALRNHKNEYQLINGNQTCSLIVHYVITRLSANQKLPQNPMVIKTIVTTDLIRQVADKYNVQLYETLTGFKHIGALITAKEGKETFLAGGEESYGYSVGDLVRDKDAVISCAIIAEMSAFYKSLGKSLFDALLDMYMEFGYYKERLVSITKKGISGAEEIKSIMHNLRENPPASIGGSQVVEIRDYNTSTATNLKNRSTSSIDLPKSNVLQFLTEDGTIVSARPSGTEPKIKFYCSVKGTLNDRAFFDSVTIELDKKLDKVMSDIVS